MVANGYCQLCGCPFGTQFTREVFRVSSKKMCESCWWDLVLNRKETYCAHCGIFFTEKEKGGQVSGSNLWYCDICKKEMEERSRVDTVPVFEIYEKYEKIRRERNEKSNHKGA